MGRTGRDPLKSLALSYHITALLDSAHDPVFCRVISGISTELILKRWFDGGFVF